MIYVLVGILIATYLLEVVFGTCKSVYNAKIGYESNCEKILKLTNREYFTKIVPFMTIAIGGPFILCKIINFYF